ncbi:MAG: hypothetical protein WCT49_03935 [Candidatus Paceibacterota bacterium]|jgi:hypothetical protein|nr:hypothetical protein [Candidatus Paceibacterota bacterium]
MLDKTQDPCAECEHAMAACILTQGECHDKKIAIQKQAEDQQQAEELMPKTENTLDLRGHEVITD